MPWAEISRPLGPLGGNCKKLNCLQAGSGWAFDLSATLVEGIFAEAGFLQKDAGDEEGVVFGVAFPEAAGFLADAVGPFEAALLDPFGGLFDFAGVEEEGGADAEHDAGVELGEVFGHEALLLGGAEADPEEIGLGGVHLANEVGFFGGVQGAEGGRVGAGDLEAGEALFEFAFEFLGHAFGAAVEEMAPAFGDAGFADEGHEVGAIDAADFGVAGELGHPDGGHAVGGAKVGVVENFAEGGVVLGFGNAVDAGDGDVAFFAAGDGLRENAEGLLVIEHADAHAEHIGAFDGGSADRVLSHRVRI